MAELIVNLKCLFRLEMEGKKALLDWCMENGLLSKSFICYKCGQSMRLEQRNDISDGYHWCCRLRERSNKHYVRKSVRKGSWFSFSHLPLTTVLQMTYLWTYKASNEFIMNETKTASHTVVDWNMFCREVCMEMCIKESVVLGGPEVVVEIFESKFNRRKCKIKDQKQKWVFAGIEKGENKCFFKVVEDRSKQILLTVIKENISPQSVLMSNCWKTYNCLSDPEFVHLKTKHGVVFQNSELGAHGNITGGTLNAVKRTLHGTHHVADEFDSYLAEYIWRKIHSSDSEGLFMAFLKSVAQVYPVRTN